MSSPRKASTVSSQYEPSSDPVDVLRRCTQRLSHRYGRGVVRAALHKVTAIFDEMQRENERISGRYRVL
jgi:hypothetical protein